MTNIAKKTAHLVSRNILSTAAVLALIGASAFAAAPTGGYLPGATLDPDCAPNDTDCIVLNVGTETDPLRKFVEGSGSLNAVYTGGNVGIGTDSPMQRLEIFDGIIQSTGENQYTDIRVKRKTSGGTDNNNDGYERAAFGVTSGSGNGFFGADNDITFIPNIETTQTPTMTLKENGNIGVGTTDPTEKLEILSGAIKVTNNSSKVMLYEDDVAEEDAFLKLVNATSAPTKFLPSLYMKSNNDDGGYTNSIVADVAEDEIGQGSVFTVMSRANNAPVVNRNLFEVHNFVSNPKFVIQAGGNVGIGATIPEAKLQIEPTNVSSIQEGLRLKDPGSGSSEGIWIQFAQAQMDDMARIGARSYDNARGSLNFYTKGTTDINSVERLRIDPNGNVGIGTTTPEAKLEISGTESPSIIFHDNQGTDQKWEIGEGISKNSGELSFKELSDGSPGSDVVFDIIGNVGIGTTSPSEKLQVTGNIKMGLTGDIVGHSIVQHYMSLGETEGGAATVLGNNVKVTDGVSNTIEKGVGPSSQYGHWMRMQYNKGITFHSTLGTTGTQSDSGTGELMRIRSDGNVGIGTTAPVSKLAVSGLPSGTTDSVASGNLAGAVCITTTGNMYIDTDGLCAN